MVKEAPVLSEVEKPISGHTLPTKTEYVTGTKENEALCQLLIVNLSSQTTQGLSIKTHKLLQSQMAPQTQGKSKVSKELTIYEWVSHLIAQEGTKETITTDQTNSEMIVRGMDGRDVGTQGSRTKAN